MPGNVQVESSTATRALPIVSLCAFSALLITAYAQLTRNFEDSKLYRLVHDSNDTKLHLSLTLTLGFCVPLLIDLACETWQRIIVKQIIKLQQNADLTAQWMVVLAMFGPSLWLFHDSHRDIFEIFWLLFHIQALVLSNAVLYFVTNLSSLAAHIRLNVLTILFNFMLSWNYFTVLWGDVGTRDIAKIIDLCLFCFTTLVCTHSCCKWAAHNLSEVHQSLVTPVEYCGFYFMMALTMWVLVLATVVMCTVFEEPVDEFGAGVPLIYASSGFAIILTVLHKRGAILRADSHETALEKKRIFVRHVSHEIRTPLNAATMGLKLLETEMHQPREERDTAMLDDLMADMKSSCAIAVDILNDLLLYEKLEAGLMHLEVSEHLVWPFVSDVLRIFRIQAKSKGVILQWAHEGLNEVKVNIDKYKLSQVIRNMISNALKFTPANGTVTVQGRLMQKKDSEKSISARDSEDYGDINSIPETPCRSTAGTEFSLSPTKQAGYNRTGRVFPRMLDVVRISVTDSGAGISKSDQKKLFGQIVQFNAGKLQNGQGSGLGLWISNSIVKHHGGKIGVFSAGEGKGSTFYIDIPVSCIEESQFKTDDENAMISEEKDESYRERYYSSLTAAKPESDNDTALLAELAPSTFRRGSLHSSSRSSALGASGRNSVDSSIKYSGTTDSETDGGGNRASYISLPDSEFYCSFKEEANLLNRRILIVDDAMTNRKFVSRLLRSKIQHRDEAADGQQACDKVAAAAAAGETYDIILMDNTMPVMNGPTATREIRASGYQGLIIGVTGNAHEADIQEFMDSGTDEVMIKPLDADKFWSTVSDLFRERITAPPQDKKESSEEERNSFLPSLFQSITPLGSGEKSMKSSASKSSGKGGAYIKSPAYAASGATGKDLSPVTPIKFLGSPSGAVSKYLGSPGGTVAGREVMSEKRSKPLCSTEGRMTSTASSPDQA